MLDPDTATEALRNWCGQRGVARGVEEFLQLLDDKDALYLLPAIRARLVDTARAENQAQTLAVQTARKLDEKQQSQLRDLVDNTDSFEQSVDAELLAGLQATHQNRRVHASLKDQLTNLHTHLTS